MSRRPVTRAHSGGMETPAKRELSVEEERSDMEENTPPKGAGIVEEQDALFDVMVARGQKLGLTGEGLARFASDGVAKEEEKIRMWHQAIEEKILRKREMRLKEKLAEQEMQLKKEKQLRLKQKDAKELQFKEEEQWRLKQKEEEEKAIKMKELQFREEE